MIYRLVMSLSLGATELTIVDGPLVNPWCAVRSTRR
jgi:hypothetical protein